MGIFRVLDALEAAGIRPTIAMDLLTAQNYPFLVEHCLGRGAEIIAHGVSVTRMITEKMGESEEREYIAKCLEGMREATGTRPRGWLGPEFGESSRTPRLLAEAGVEYVCDWTNDEQPYAMTTPTGSLVSLPICLDLDDVNALWERRMDVERYAGLVKESFDRLLEDGKTTGRLLALNLHPWLVGQPFRIGYLGGCPGALNGAGGGVGGHRVGDCGLVPEDCVVAFVSSKTRKGGGSVVEPPPFFLVSSTGCFEA